MINALIKVRGGIVPATHGPRRRAEPGLGQGFTFVRDGAYDPDSADLNSSLRALYKCR
jgi:hypothetical protein